MSLYKKNSFENYQSENLGKNFVGRSDEIEIIKERIIEDDDSGSLAIIGLPEIGKSSLVCHCLYSRKEELLERKILVIETNMKAVDTPTTFFKGIIRDALDEFEIEGVLEDRMKKAGKNAIEQAKDQTTLFSGLQKFIRIVRKMGWRIVLIVKEFDAVTTVFKDNINALTQLQGLIDNPDRRISIVALSFQNLSEIDSESLTNPEG